jgi:hypothetical protein
VEVTRQLERVPAPRAVAADSRRINPSEASRRNRLQPVLITAERAELPLDLDLATRPAAPQLQLA